MARHWLIRKDVLLDAGGYQADFSKALEFDLLLRIIEQGGLAWLAHLDEPLLIARAPVLEENAHERQALIRHLATRGYKAQVTSDEPGTYRSTTVTLNVRWCRSSCRARTIWRSCNVA